MSLAHKPPRKPRAKARTLVPKPEPDPDVPGQIVSEVISVVKVSLAGVVKDEAFRAEVEKVVVAANQMCKRVTMLAKELVLTKLAAEETLPAMDQSFYSRLYTSIRSGSWDHGHDELLTKRQAEDPGLGSVMGQVMGLAGRRLAAEVATHYRSHYERFYRRWLRACNQACKDDALDSVLKSRLVLSLDENQARFKLDADTTEPNQLLRPAWTMRGDLEAVGVRGFALFPETKVRISYLSLDARCVAYIFRSMHSHSFLVPGTSRKKGIADVAMEHGKEIFAEVFKMDKVTGLRRNHHFRYSLQTDGVGVALSFGRWVRSVPSQSADILAEGSPPAKRRKKSKGRKKLATAKAVGELRPGLAYSAQNKTLRELSDLRGMTVRAVDPGVRRTYTSVDLLTGESDVRASVKMMRSRSWHRRSGARAHTARMKTWHDDELGEVQRELNTTPFRTSARADLYGQYVDATLRHWDALWDFAVKRKVRKLRFRAEAKAQKELDREVDRLCAPREGDTKTLLVYGDAASTGIFGRTKKNVKGPARKLFDVAVRRKKAVCVWADEFRTSQLDIFGRPVVHPPETRSDRLQKPKCKAERHAADAPGCRCYCSHQGCTAERTCPRWCAAHARTQFRYDVCYSNTRSSDDKHQHRMWNRDVLAALNIGCLFLAKALGRDAGLWRRGTTADPGRPGTLTSPLSWAEIFGADNALIFSLPAASHQTAQATAVV
jgi:hypothetical protein